MNEMVNKFLLAGDKFIPEIHLSLDLHIVLVDHFQKFKETGDSRYIYQNELDKACLQHDMVYGDFKDLSRRLASDKMLCDKAFNIAKNPKYDGYQRGLASLVYIFLIKNFWQRIKSKIISNKELAEDLQKPILRKSKKRKVHSHFIDNICGADLADMQLINKLNKAIRILLCAIDIFGKCA